MPHDISIHVASGDEKLAAYHNAFQHWSRGRSLDAFLDRWLTSVKHNRAERWVLTAGGEVAAALGCYPMQFRVGSQTLPGFGIGEVHTPPAHRGQGYASQLVEEAARGRAAQGDQVAILYSDIEPAFYARLGYRASPAWMFSCDDLQSLAAGIPLPSREGLGEGQRHPHQDLSSKERGSRPDLNLEPIDPVHELDRIAADFDRATAVDEFWIARDRAYWEYNLAARPDDRFFAVRDSAAAGYVRLALGEETEIVETAVSPWDAPTEERVLRAVAALATQSGAARLWGWLRDTPTAARLLKRTQRSLAIPMVRALSPEVVISDRAIATAHFWNSDHV